MLRGADDGVPDLPQADEVGCRVLNAAVAGVVAKAAADDPATGAIGVPLFCVRGSG